MTLLSHLLLLQTLAIYDRFGRLMLGSEEQEKDVLEYLVMERHLVNPYGLWRLHGKIVPSWAPAKDPVIKVTFSALHPLTHIYLFLVRKRKKSRHTSCQKEMRKALLSGQFIRHLGGFLSSFTVNVSLFYLTALSNVLITCEVVLSVCVSPHNTGLE